MFVDFVPNLLNESIHFPFIKGVSRVVPHFSSEAVTGLYRYYRYTSPSSELVARRTNDIVVMASVVTPKRSLIAGVESDPHPVFFICLADILQWKEYQEDHYVGNIRPLPCPELVDMV
ncbi:hypothetical protein TNCV_3757291 [Trichonephila clavipes]|nr:hypothetical protein TNCV_3757291 [Trichonephila clavipes]